MIYNQYQQYELSDRIMQAVCEVGKVTFMELCSAVKTVKLNTLRGLYCLISRDYCIHPDRSARLLCRTRANIINQARKYMQYVQSKDKYTLSIYNQIVELLKSNKE
ncbi:hypothetical protein DW657_17070 [Prevotella sp. AM23-5]|uniref:hypothetical protein n=1 Tax=Prevotellaceae TaxID=171552 RepID=UPI000E53F343|nr:MULTISPECIES: hypothetical protein [Prevotellaceae]RHN83855.1 hypothetical protein DW657_17070 [Prevotella sp. AM23-5]